MGVVKIERRELKVAHLAEMYNIHKSKKSILHLNKCPICPRRGIA